MLSPVLIASTRAAAGSLAWLASLSSHEVAIHATATTTATASTTSHQFSG
ncbi:hypothetical protein [Actinocrispum sp. NPDC049592]